MSTKLFTVAIMYFKPSGKFYTYTIVEKEFTSLEPDGSCYMNDVVDWMRGMIQNKNQPLPGLSSKTWDGPVFLNCDRGHPCLVMPSNKSAAAQSEGLRRNNANT